MALDWQKGTIIRIEDEAANTKRFFIRVNGTESFDFKAGQFVTLDLPINEKPGKRWRSYSIASWPDHSNVFELLIVFLEGGAGTKYLFEHAGIGSELTFRGPQGVFTLPDSIERDLFFICTGTGIAPFRSMLNYILRRNLPHQNLYLIFGCRTRKDLLYYDEMCGLETQIPGFRYLPTLSREEWAGHHGYVHTLYEDICKQNRESAGHPDIVKPAHFYLCGWKAMIDEAKKRIAELGYDKKSIHLELYG
ncbi:MAG TPA: FAD-binding oxidoreductase [Chitinophagaceae bacterium]|nr:FAD-binding oxidoreductase [Chitinophagaceae bacterium]